MRGDDQVGGRTSVPTVLVARRNRCGRCCALGERRQAGLVRAEVKPDPIPPATARQSTSVVGSTSATRTFSGSPRSARSADTCQLNVSIRARLVRQYRIQDVDRVPGEPGDIVGSQLGLVLSSTASVTWSARDSVIIGRLGERGTWSPALARRCSQTALAAAVAGVQGGDLGEARTAMQRQRTQPQIVVSFDRSGYGLRISA